MQGFNMGRYVPPDQEGVVSGNKLAGKHPLGHRARHLQTTGPLVVRFEMPFPIWCSTCQPAESVIIGQGVRFNAEKKKVGNYYSTPIYSFRMKHAACGGWIEIRTDPKNTEYVVTEGARRKITSEFGKGEYEEDGVGEIRVKPPGEEGGVEDPFAKWEGKMVDKSKYMTAQTRMEELLKRQATDWEDPYEKSRKLRRIFRAERKGREAAQVEAEAIKDKMSLGIELVAENEADKVRAGMINFGSSGVESMDGLSDRARTRPLFETSSSHSKSDTLLARHTRKTMDKDRTRKAVTKKDLLRRELTGNTKAAMDPFLNDVDEVWQPGTKKRKDKANGVKGTLPDPDILDSELGPASHLEEQEKELLQPDRMAETDGNPDCRENIVTPLVAYGSDSD